MSFPLFRQSFPLFRQLDAMDCGAACLRMIAAHYGRRFDTAYLRELCSIGKGGVSLLGITEAAERIGLRSLAVKLPFSRLAAEAPLPCIAHWEQNHFVVVHKIARGTVQVADPAKGLISYTRAEFLDGWLPKGRQGSPDEPGILLLLETTPAFHTTAASEVQDKEAPGMGFFLSYLRPHKRIFVQLLIGLVVVLVFNLLLPFFAQTVVDLGIGNLDLQLVILMLAGQLMLSLGRTAIDMLQAWALLHIGSHIGLALIADFLTKLLRLPLSFFHTRTPGDIMQRIEDHRRVNTFLTSSSLQAVFSVASFLVFGVVLAIYNAWILAVFVALTGASTGWLWLFLKRRRVLDRKRFDLQSKEQNKYVELVQGAQEIKVHGLERKKRWEWEDLAARSFKVNLQRLALQNTQRTGTAFIDQLRNILITFIAARAVIRGEMSLGMMLSTQFIVGQLTEPVERLVEVMYQAQDARLSLERMLEVHTEKEEEHYVHNKRRDFPVSRTLRVQALSFRYPGAGELEVLNNVNLTIPESKVTAIVGASGSGKTTLLKLLLALYQPARGEIYIGDEPFGTFDARAWRARVGAVMQDGYIFSGSIAQNIACTSAPPDELRLHKVVRLASMEDFSAGLPLGLATRIGDEGQGLSGGQKQRILLARALYKDPEFLFLDEATSSLDANNERTIMNHLREFVQGRTVVVIAHRLSTVRDADQIVVLDQGRIVEQGNHEALARLRGHYYELVRNQLELEKTADAQTTFIATA